MKIKLSELRELIYEEFESVVNGEVYTLSEGVDFEDLNIEDQIRVFVNETIQDMMSEAIPSLIGKAKTLGTSVLQKNKNMNINLMKKARNKSIKAGNIGAAKGYHSTMNTMKKQGLGTHAKTTAKVGAAAAAPAVAAGGIYKLGKRRGRNQERKRYK